MRKENRKKFCVAVCMLTAFVLWTVLVSVVDVQGIGPEGSTVGFARMNGWIHNVTGVHMFLYTATDWLSMISLGFVLGFALLGLVQWMGRKSLLKVDYSILVLGGFYLVVIAVFAFFETFVVNYRPVLIEGILEASYPSSTTMLVMCVMPTAGMQLNARIKNEVLRRCVAAAIALFTVCMVAARLLSGVHWFSDIIGGALLSTGLVMLYGLISSLEGQ